MTERTWRDIIRALPRQNLEVIVEQAFTIAADAPQVKSKYAYRAGIKWTNIHDLRTAFETVLAGYAVPWHKRK